MHSSISILWCCYCSVSTRSARASSTTFYESYKWSADDGVWKKEQNTRTKGQLSDSLRAAWCSCIGVCDVGLLGGVLLLFSDHMFSSSSSCIVVHLPFALRTHVRTPLHAYQTLYPQQGGLSSLHGQTQTTLLFPHHMFRFFVVFSGSEPY